jgi:CHAP domain
VTSPATVNEAVERVLNRVRGALGTKEVPDGSNNNFIVQWYNDTVDKVGLGPWCQMTMTWAFYTTDFNSLFPATAWTVQAARNAVAKIDNMSWHDGTAGVLPGDLVYYDWSGNREFNKIDHVGIVEKVNPDGTLYVLEGNASNAVRRMHRDAKYVVGYIRLDWNRVVVKVTPAPQPKPGPAPTPTSVTQTAIAQIKVIQGLVGVAQDGVWGPVTDKAFLSWRNGKKYTRGQIQLLQKTLGNGLKQDGIWGDLTDTAVLVFRKQHLVK